jgi:hypothetical protein
MRSTAHRTIVLLAPLVLGSVATYAWAQVSSPPSPVIPATPGAADGGGAAWSLAIIVALIVAVGVAVKLYDHKRRREAEAVQIQAQISDALMRDATLFGMPVVANATVPFTRGPVRIEMAGQVPSEAHREAIIRLARGEAARIRPDVVIADRMSIVPGLEAPGADRRAA